MLSQKKVVFKKFVLEITFGVWDHGSQKCLEAAALLVRAGARLQPGPDYVSLALQHGQYSLASCLLAAGASPSRLAALPAPAAAWLSSRKHSTATLKGHATNIDIKTPQKQVSQKRDRAPQQFRHL